MSVTTYIIYDHVGKIISVGECSESAVDIQYVPPGCFLLAGVTGHWDTHYVENGVVFEKGQPPGIGYVFDYETKTWALDNAFAAKQAVEVRNNLLASTDWTQLPDVQLANKMAWATYRQALRDITEQPEYPQNIVWPTEPSNT